MADLVSLGRTTPAGLRQVADRGSARTAGEPRRRRRGHGAGSAHLDSPHGPMTRRAAADPRGALGAGPPRRPGRAVNEDVLAARSPPRAACWATIARQPLGGGGFGYDPVFVPDGRAAHPGRDGARGEERHQPPGARVAAPAAVGAHGVRAQLVSPAAGGWCGGRPARLTAAGPRPRPGRGTDRQPEAPQALGDRRSVGSRALQMHRGRGVAQSGSAPALGAGGREFESRRPDQPNYRCDLFACALLAAAISFHQQHSLEFLPNSRGQPSHVHPACDPLPDVVVAPPGDLVPARSERAKTQLATKLVVYSRCNVSDTGSIPAISTWMGLTLNGQPHVFVERQEQLNLQYQDLLDNELPLVERLVRERARWCVPSMRTASKSPGRKSTTR